MKASSTGDEQTSVARPPSTPCASGQPPPAWHVRHAGHSLLLCWLDRGRQPLDGGQVSAGSVIFLQAGFAAVQLFYMGSVLTSVTIANLPLLKQKFARSDEQ